MSLEIVREVSRENPTLLPANLGGTCFSHTQILIDKLRARGHDAWLMCKTGNEGGYAPSGFKPFEIVGLDGYSKFTCTRFSHDAIWCDGKQFDTLGSANEHDRPIYRIPGSNDVSFDPASGPQIQAVPIWNEIPREFWRNNNPPFKSGGALPVPSPSLPSSAPVAKPYPGDAYFVDKIGALLEADYIAAGQSLNAGSATWFARTIWRHVNEGMSIDDSVAKSRVEWRAALGLR